MRFSFILIAATSAFLGSSSPISAQNVKDMFGQEVPVEIDTKVEELKKQRQEATSATELEAIASDLKEVIEEKPNYYRGWFNLGLTKLKKSPSNPDDFIEPFNKAIELHETDPNLKEGSIYNTVGWAMLENQRYEDAEEFLLKAQELSDKNTDWTNAASAYNLGRLYFETQEYDKAEKFLTESADTHKNPAAVDLLKVLEKVEK